MKVQYYTPEELSELRDGYSDIGLQYNLILSTFSNLDLSNPGASEYVNQGFLCRINILKRCIENIYTLCPPEEACKPTATTLTDLSINLQSFIFNVFGCIDNLAWVWVKEKNFSYKNRTEVSFLNKKIKFELSTNFSNYLDKLDNWYIEHIKDFRDASAHRIPLYIPPFTVTSSESKLYNDLEDQKFEAIKKEDFEKVDILEAEQSELGRFIPCITHSYTERKSPPVAFHVQILADWNTVIDFAKFFLEEITESN